jgi:hypothetical protein
VHLLILIFLVVGFSIVIVFGLLSSLHDLLGIDFSLPPVRCIEVPDSDEALGENREQSIVSEL